MNKYTKQHSKPELQDKHKTLCYEYRNVISLEEANAQYVIIYCWWYSSGVIDEVRLQKLENWFPFLPTFLTISHLHYQLF